MDWLRDTAKLIFRSGNAVDEKYANSNHFQFYRFTDVTQAAWEQFRPAYDGEPVPKILCRNAQGPISFCDIQDEVKIPRSRVLVQIEMDGTFTCWDAVAVGLYVFQFSQEHTAGEKVPHPSRRGVFLNYNTLRLIRYALQNMDQSSLDVYIRYLKRSAEHSSTLALGWGAICVATQVTTGFPLAELSVEYFLSTLCSLSLGGVYSTYIDPAPVDQMLGHYAKCELAVPWELYLQQLNQEMITVLEVMREGKSPEEKWENQDASPRERIDSLNTLRRRRSGMESGNPFSDVSNPFDAAPSALHVPEAPELDPWGEPYKR